MQLKDIKVGDYLSQVLDCGTKENKLVKVIALHDDGTIEHIHYPEQCTTTFAYSMAFAPITLEQIAMLAEHPTEEFHL